MSPDRKQKIGKTLIEEFCWNGRAVVYVNGKKSELSFDAAVHLATTEG